MEEKPYFRDTITIHKITYHPEVERNSNAAEGKRSANIVNSNVAELHTFEIMLRNIISLLFFCLLSLSGKDTVCPLNGSSLWSRLLVIQSKELMSGFMVHGPDQLRQSEYLHTGFFIRVLVGPFAGSYIQLHKKQVRLRDRKCKCSFF